jgi:hypothetical protein
MRVRARIVHVAGVLPLHRTTDTEIAITSRGQGLAQPLIFQREALVDEREVACRIPLFAHRVQQPIRSREPTEGAARLPASFPGALRASSQNPSS